MIASKDDKGINNSSLFLIRKANPADAEQIISGINTICLEGGAFYTTKFVSTPQWDAVLYRPETVSDHSLLVAELNNEIVGVGRLFPGVEYTLIKHVAELGIFVLSSFRRQGIGTQLLTRLVKKAAQNNLEKISLVVFSTNHPAIQFFEKYGFIQEGRMNRQIKTAGNYIDLLHMGLFIEDTYER